MGQRKPEAAGLHSTHHCTINMLPQRAKPKGFDLGSKPKKTDSPRTRPVVAIKNNVKRINPSLDTVRKWPYRCLSLEGGEENKWLKVPV